MNDYTVANATAKMTVLDHGYVQLVETWGSDARIIEAARMSTDKGFRGWEPEYTYRCLSETCIYTLVTECNFANESPLRCPGCGQHTLSLKSSTGGDFKLLRYLYEHKHHTPFEMAGMTIEVQAPIFVFREWHRHRTQSYNELSARYTALPDLFYLPSEERVMLAKQSATNKQSSEAATFTPAMVTQIRETIDMANIDARQRYEELLALGVAREVARLVIPVSQYSRMRASANLRNWLSFLTLRTDEAAQWEIRQYAQLVAQLVELHFPRTYALFAEGKKIPKSLY